MTQFRQLAEKIAEKPDRFWLCCVGLKGKEKIFFQKEFEPTRRERIEYNHLYGAWMGDWNKSIYHNNQLRILALLFAEQIWEEERKDKPKNKKA